MQFWSIFIVAFLVGAVYADDEPADDQQAINLCKTFHPDHVDEHLTRFLNSKCSVNCYIRGYPWTHLLNENQACPDNDKGVCKSGQCEENRPVDPNHKKLGHIDIEMMSTSASVSGFYYATACIQNNTNSVTFPMTDRSQCAICTTKTPEKKDYFVEWNTVCTGSGKAIWQEESRVTFEVFSQVDEGHHDYIGTSTLTIPQILSNSDNNKKLHLPITGSPAAAQITVRVTWSPIDA